MIDVAAVPEQESQPPFDPVHPDRHTDEELDEQPFGIICLDAGGKIRPEEDGPAGLWFSLVPWDEPRPVPEMPAGDFLDAVASRQR